MIKTVQSRTQNVGMRTSIEWQTTRDDAVVDRRGGIQLSLEESDVAITSSSISITDSQCVRIRVSCSRGLPNS